MFVSASLDLKLHSFTEGGVETLPMLNSFSPCKIINVSICNDNSYIAFLRENEKPQILSAKDKQNVRLIHTINVANISTITFKRNTKRNIAMGTKGGDVIMYDTKTRTISNTYPKVSQAIRALDFTCNDQQLCGIDATTFFVFPDISNNDEVQRYKHAAECTFLKCHPFIPNRVAIGGANCRVGLWDVQMGVELINLEMLQSPVTGISMSSCGNYLIAAGKDLKICGLDFLAGTCNFQYQVDQEKPVSCIDLSPDDRHLAVGLIDGTLKFYDIEKMKLIHSCKLHGSRINTIVFENKPPEPNFHFSSVMKLSEQESKENESIEACSVKNRSVKSGRTGEHKDEALEKLKKGLLKVIKGEMDGLENQLNEHCAKFQKFLDNEFETIDDIMRKKWDIFNVGDTTQIMKAICPEEARSSVD